jgi:hypothetical protein
VPTLSLEDTLLMLTIQISKDAGSRYFQLAKLCDMAALLRTHPDLELTGVLSHAKELGGERMVQFSVCLAHNLLATPLPQEILGEVLTQPVIDQLVEFTRLQLVDDRDPIARDQRSIDQFRWLVRERLRDKLHPYYFRYVHAAFAPCRLDRQLLPLPHGFGFLYYGIRPIRLLCKYSLLLFRRHLGTKLS